MKKLLTLVLALAMAFSLAITPASAATSTRFKDVPTTHWAYESIEALAVGGLVGGYGGGYFGPNDTLNIDQMAQIICNAKGFARDTGNSYWAYDEVSYCINELYCLPNLGAVNSTNYSVPCSRELAVYMMTKGLGSSGNANANYSLTAKDIPDYASINPTYAPTILKAYQMGLIAGVDSNRTFNPKANLTRAQACTVLNRAGFTTAATKPTGTGTGLSADEIYTELASWGIWKETTNANGSTKYLTTTDAKYGGINIAFPQKGTVLIYMYEKNSAGMYSSDGSGFVDVDGNKLTDEMYRNGFKDANGKVVVSSGWSYEARQLVKKVLSVIYPTQSAEAYNAMLSVMKQEIWEIPSKTLPSAIRWLDGRTYTVTLSQSSNCMILSTGKLNDTDSYTADLSGAAIGTQSTYISVFGGRDVTKHFELSRG